MMGDLLRGSAVIAAILSGNAQAQGHFPAAERMQDGVCPYGYRALYQPQGNDLPCCMPARRAVARLCPRA